MKDKLLLIIGIGAIALAFAGPALAGATGGQGATPWGPFSMMDRDMMFGGSGMMDRDMGSGRMDRDMMFGGSGMMDRDMMFGGSGNISSQPDSTIQGAAEITVTLDDFAISPSPVVITAGQATNITVTNTGAAPHDFTVPDLGIKIVVAPGETATAGVPAQPAGTYDTLCTVAGHASLGMVGTLVVEAQA